MARQKKDPTKRPQENESNDDPGQASPDSPQQTNSTSEDLQVNKVPQAAPGDTLANKIVELMFSKMKTTAEVCQDSKPHKPPQANGQAETPSAASTTSSSSRATTEEAILDLSVKTKASTSSTGEEVRVKVEEEEEDEDSEVFDDVGALDLSMKRKSSATQQDSKRRRRSSDNNSGGTYPTPPCTPKNNNTTSPNFVFSPVPNGHPLPTRVVPNPAMQTAHHALGATVVAALMGQNSAAGHPAALPASLHQIPANRDAAGMNLTAKPVTVAAAAGHHPPPMIVTPHHGQPTLLRFPYAALPPGTFVAPAGLPGGGPRLISPHLLATLRPPLVVNRGHLTIPHPPSSSIDPKPAGHGHSPPTADVLKAPHLLKYMAAGQTSPQAMSPPDRKSPNSQENHHHVVRAGNAPLVFTCKTCGIPFPTVRKLAGHMKIHNNDKLYYSITVEENGQDSTIYVCQTCGTQFTIYENLISHMQHHGGEDMYSFYICEVCNARFTQASDLKIHSRIHIRDKPFTCDICKNKFTHLQSLKTHQRIHTGEKPYQCKVCQARFTQLGHLKAHSRIHTGEKPYQCGTCGAKFSQLGTLKVHMRIHTGEKPYQCKTCDARFTHLRSLKLHTLRSHMEELTQAEQDQLKQDTGTVSSATQRESPEPQAAASAAAAGADVE